MRLKCFISPHAMQVLRGAVKDAVVDKGRIEVEIGGVLIQQVLFELIEVACVILTSEL